MTSMEGSPSFEPGKVAAYVLAYSKGARFFRTRDEGDVVQALAVTQAIVEAAE